MKYIIDIPKEYESDWVNKSSRLGFELCFPINETATNKKYYIPTGFKLEPYTEPDRKVTEDETWELADWLKLLKRILESGDCNDCALLNSQCRYAPRWGEQVRYNCPFYSKEGDKE